MNPYKKIRIIIKLKLLHGLTPFLYFRVKPGKVLEGSRTGSMFSVTDLLAKMLTNTVGTVY